MRGQQQPRKRKAAADNPDSVARNAREEMVLHLFRDLPLHQQREAVRELMALYDANRVSRKLMKGKPLRAVSNEDVRAAFKDVPVPKKKSSTKKKPGRDLGDAMGDYIDD